MTVTRAPGTLVVASAYPDPPFDIIANGVPDGFDVQLMRAVCKLLGIAIQAVRYEGSNFNGIFDGLRDGTYDAVISGTTITPERERVALFTEPYLEFGQGVAVNCERTPNVRAATDLHGLTAGIQQGNTSDAVARAFVAEGLIAGIRYYPYDAIQQALDDLESGRIGLVVKLLPVISHLIEDRPALTVAFEVPTHERLGIAVAQGNTTLCSAIDGALNTLRTNGELQALRDRWIGADATRGPVSER
jgi:polar amino acid transport system substrate-binding protein